MMIQILIFFVFALVVGCSFAPQPPQVCLTEDVKPINFFNAKRNNRNTIIISEQQQKGWRKKFAYSFDTQNPSPEFFYAIAHADQIIAHIKSPSINSVSSKLTSDLKRYGVVTRIKLLVTDHNQKPQVILECIKFAEKN